MNIWKFYYDCVPHWIRKSRPLMFLKSLYRKYNQIGAKKYPYPDKTVLDYDWDYLIVIDACRHDLFEEVYGETDYIISNGSSTPEWRNRTFTQDKYKDIVYISANPRMSEVEMNEAIGGMPFYHLEKVYLDGWNDKLHCPPPKEVFKAAVRCDKRYPGKKKIIHFLQPHFPFIGEVRLNRAIKEIKGEKREKDVKKVGSLGQNHAPWNSIRIGTESVEEVWEAYKSNLKLVMRYVNKLTDKLDGKIILTSDHGNCKGEYGMYGHPWYQRVEELVKVPLVVYD